MICFENVNQRYGSSQILWDLNMQIQPGAITCLMGRNGVGKTTLLKTLMGLLPISSGRISIGDQDFCDLSVEDRPRLGIGFVPQGRDIFPQLTVEENLKIGLVCRGDRSKTIPNKIFELFPVLQDMLGRRGGDLSGGQQQQLAIGRALVLAPALLILDEPNEGIQPNIVKQIGDVLLKLNHEEGLTVLLVEQKLNFARWVGSDFNLMERGRIVASGPMPTLSEGLIEQHLAV